MLPLPDHRLLYKAIPNATTDGCHADVYLPSTVAGAPVAIMIHGGGWCTGSSTNIPHDQVTYLTSHGVAVISLEYRLAPHVRMSEIRDDLVDAYVWVQTRLNDQLGLGKANGLAVERCLLMGWSAGATACLHIDTDIFNRRPDIPRPLGLIPTYPLTTLNTPQSLPISAFEDRLAAAPEEEKRLVGTLMNEMVCCGIPQNNFGGWPDCPGAKTPRDLWCKHMLLSGSLSAYLHSQPPPFPSSACPLSSISPTHSPTFLVCATGDRLIPPSHSYTYFERLNFLGVECVLKEAIGMPHGIAEKGRELWPVEQDWWAEAVLPSLEWGVGKLWGNGGARVDGGEGMGGRDGPQVVTDGGADTDSAESGSGSATGSSPTSTAQTAHAPSNTNTRSASVSMDSDRPQTSKRRRVDRSQRYRSPKKLFLLGLLAAFAPKALASCISSGDQNDFNQLLSENGPGYVVELCPSTTYELTGPIIFTAKDQEISTAGYPDDTELKARLLLSGGNRSTLVQGDCRRCARVSIRNLIIDGNRSNLGRMNTSDDTIVSSAMILFGNNEGQAVRDCVIRDPRGWAAIQLREGDQLACRGALIEGNVIGPVGEEWIEALDGDDPEASPLGKPLADGLSLACKDSIVRGNTFFDNTDAAIVVYCATGSHISSNTIQSINHAAMGGILMVDAVPFEGDYTNTRVQNNIIEAEENALMRVGIGIGSRVWSDDTETVIRGGIITENVFRGSGMGYGIAVAGVDNFTIVENESVARHGGSRGSRCLVPLEEGDPAAEGMTDEERERGLIRNPLPIPFLTYKDSYTGGELQEEFEDAEFTYLVCLDPEFMDDGSVRPSVTATIVRPTADITRDPDAPPAATDADQSPATPPADSTNPSSDETPLTSVLQEVLTHSEGRLLQAISSIDQQVDSFMEGTQIQKQILGGRVLGKGRLGVGVEENTNSLLASLATLATRVSTLEAERGMLRGAMDDLQKEFRNFGSMLTRAQNQDAAILADLRMLLRQHQVHGADHKTAQAPQDQPVDGSERFLHEERGDVATSDWKWPIVWLLMGQAALGVSSVCWKRYIRKTKVEKRL